jgi:hypothetical protein
MKKVEKLPSRNYCSLRQPSGNKSPRWKGSVYFSGQLISQWKKNAEVRNHEWELTHDDLDSMWEEQEGKCAYSGLELRLYQAGDRRFGNRYAMTVSIDRIDNGLGYFVGNVHFVHKKVNQIKMDMEEAEFLELCHAIAEHTKDVARK